jgi:hypothetical protein
MDLGPTCQETVTLKRSGSRAEATISGTTTEAAISDANDFALLEVTSTDGFSPKAHQRKMPRTPIMMRLQSSNEQARGPIGLLLFVLKNRG